MRKLKRKRILVPVVAIAMIAVAGIAVAFFTASGSGSGTASVGRDAGVTITDVTFGGALYPGTSTSVSFTVRNASSSTSVQVGKVVADTLAGTNGITGLTGGCAAADFSFADVTVGETIAADGSTTGSGTLRMAETGANQDACQGQSPVLNLKVDNS